VPRAVLCMYLVLFVKSSPVAQVTALRWGDYVGSPDQPAAVIAWSSHHLHTAVKLVALPTGEVFGLDPSSTLLVRETGKHVIVCCEVSNLVNVLCSTKV